MTCVSCGQDSPAEARFCMHCAAPLPRRCVQCGGALPAVARFCPQCAHPVAAVTAQSPVHAATSVEARKVVTIVFADLIGSTSLHERLDAESTRRLMERYYQALREAIEAHGGTVVKFLGDGVMAAFGVPQVAEDDAIRAVRAAVAMQHAFRELRASTTTALVDVGLRIGINTGEVIVSADNTDVVGDPANVAARLQQEARDGEAIIGEATRRLVRELVTLESIGVRALKGRTETVAAYRVVSLDRPAGAAAVAFVGRDDELRRLLAVYHTAVADSRTRLAMILGSPGLGKSRLLEEVTRRVSNGAMVLSARCESAGGATFAPIARAVRVYLRSDLAGGVQIPLPTKEGEDLRAVVAAALPDTTERSRIADGVAALLAGTPAAPEETFFVVRRFLAELAARQPVVLAVDDLQWAEPLLLDLIEHLVQWGTGMPVLVLAAARPELRALRSSLTVPGALAREVVILAGLDASAAMRLAANVIGTDVLPAAVAGRVLATSEGNPLFVAELVRMLVHDGALKPDGGRWTAAVDLATLDMPPTIHALLAARIERVRAEDRTVLERAAVIGRQFSRGAVAHLLPREVCDLDARLEALRRSELIEPDTAWFLGEPALRFHHGLTRDAAYRRLLKETRADLHGRVAEWIEHRVGDSIEHDEMIGWHLEQAHQHLRELGPLDATGTALGERAARYLGAAGRRALARDDVSVAADLLGRALRALDEASPARADLTLDWCEALLAAGDVAHAKTAIDALGGLKGLGVKGLGVMGGDQPLTANPLAPNPLRLAAWHICFTAQLAVLTDPQALRGTVEALAAAASELARLGDVAGEAKAHQVHALALQRMGAIGTAETALDKALAAARQVNDRRRSNAVLAGAPQAALWGPSPVTRASGRCLDVVRVLRITQGAAAVEAVALRCQAVLEALRGRSDAARRMITSARKMVEELGITQQVLETDLYSGLIELIEENAAAAARSLSIAYEGFRANGLAIDAARAGALLGRALFVQGHANEAERVSHESEALAGDDLQAAIAWRRVRAETLAARGEHAGAVEVARTAVAIAAATDALLLHANARIALAAALRAAGREREATAEEARAIELWETKGATLLVERARAAQTTAQGRTLKPAPTGPTESALVAAPIRARSLAEEHPCASPLGKGSIEEGTLRTARRVRLNAATAHASRVTAAVAAGDADALAALVADDVEVVDHTTGAVIDRNGVLISYRALLRAQDPTCRFEPLAILGDSLALCRQTSSASGYTGGIVDVDAIEGEKLSLIEADAKARARRTEDFASNRLGDAVVRLYERYAELLPDGPERTRAATIAHSIGVMTQAYDPEAFAGAWAANIEYADHRTAGVGALTGIPAIQQWLRSLLDDAEDVTNRIEEVLAANPSALLVRNTNTGALRVSRGPYERPFLQLMVLGSEGLVARMELFDAERAAEALARFDALVNPSVSPLGRGRMEEGSREPHFANAATRLNERFTRAWLARDWDALTALHAPTCQVEDRRRLMRVEGGIDLTMENFRVYFEVPNSRWTITPLATRGERLALSRLLFEGEVVEGGGDLAIDYLCVDEVDGEGRSIAILVFDPDDLDAAYAELDRRYDAGEGVALGGLNTLLGQSIAKRDWEALAALCAPTLEEHDHRRITGLGTTRGVEAWVEKNVRVWIDLAPDVVGRFTHIRGCDRGFLQQLVLQGSRHGGSFEIAFAGVVELDAQRRIERIDIYDLDQLDAARARFNELTGGPQEPLPLPLSQAERGAIPPSLAGKGARGLGSAPPAVRFENAATRMNDRITQAWAARDWEAVVALHAPGCRADDRRRLMRTRIPLGTHFEQLRVFFDGPHSRWVITPIATRAERLSLSRMSFEGEVEAGGGALAIDYLVLDEVDDEGRSLEIVLFDPDDLDAAYAELDQRFDAGEAAAYPHVLKGHQEVEQALATRDWERFTAALSPAVVIEDHRPLGYGAFVGGFRSRDEYEVSFRALLELAPDVTLRVDHVLALDDRGLLLMFRWLGTRDGGQFEIPMVIASAVGPDGLIQRVDAYSLDQLDEARAHFEELRPDPLRIPPNAATRAGDRWLACIENREWQDLTDLFAP
ncbi:MAG TPA: nuclear transport factor 2 family protein, partial [Candidatus Binatia bacterium]|nr:nuclear transport factor 2 family protein [Candidatus Binatia bacterium]